MHPAWLRQVRAAFAVAREGELGYERFRKPKFWPTFHPCHNNRKSFLREAVYTFLMGW